MSQAFRVGSELMDKTIKGVNLQFNTLILLLNNDVKVEIKAKCANDKPQLSISVRDSVTNKLEAGYAGQETY